MSQPKKRRQWSAADKMRIVLAGLEAGTEVSELCRVEGILRKSVDRGLDDQTVGD